MTSNDSEIEMPTESTESTGVFQFKDKPFFDKEHLKFLFFSQKGRINRKRYWFSALLLIIVYFIAMAFMVILSPDDTSSTFILLFFVIWALSLYISIMLMIKRLHDRNRPSAFIILMFIPIVNLWPTIEILFLKGTSGDNRFGADPLS